MNEELEPLGLPSQEGAGPTFRELVSQHPVAALAVSAVIGAGVVALIGAAAQRRQPSSYPEAIGNQASEAYADLRHQLSQWVERLNTSLPSPDAVRQTANDLGARASKVIDQASSAAKQTFRRGAAMEHDAAQAVAAHPLMQSLAVGAAGAVIAALTKASRSSSAETAPPVVNGHDKEATTPAPGSGV